MQQLELLKKVIGQLEDRKVDYILCGGIAASLYRDKPRLTNDVDLAIFYKNYDDSKAIAKEIIESIGARASLGWIPQLKEKYIKTMALVIGQFDSENYDATVDIILPNLPWVEKAISNGKNHVIDYGFAGIPVITVDDLIIAKIFALNVEPNRFQDLDDLKSIFLSSVELNLPYIKSAMVNYEINVPDTLWDFCPSLLKK
ncbi:MAG TPA: nucleotidyl transferase AbiEii/AbiGii toxin family protein [Oligoflexia bacterium]|nr:nucleotidyl transferase AbiEii/AbiGii toxin family protein [Oligoflexia bacterium]HMP49387.1 nucleotidyl transferase AbiEii/AbiGii toxin family protein [Oligoflexia bacterium]